MSETTATAVCTVCSGFYIFFSLNSPSCCHQLLNIHVTSSYWATSTFTSTETSPTPRSSTTGSSHGLVQLVTGPTHRRGHTLDVVITRPSSLVTEISAALPSLSDHCIVTFSAYHEPPTTTVERVERRCYKTFDPAAFILFSFILLNFIAPIIRMKFTDQINSTQIIRIQ